MIPFMAGTLLALAPAQAAPADPLIGSGWTVEIDFTTPPPRAVPVKGSSCEVADRYVTLVGQRRGKEIAQLFSEDAIFLGPDDRIVRGRAAIDAFYSIAVEQRVSHVIPLSFMDRGRECIMEIAVASADEPGRYRLMAMDHFTLAEDGRIDRLLIYFRPALFTRKPN